MVSTRLDRLTSVFGARHTRRNTIKATGLGAVAAGTYSWRQPAAAQAATPAAASLESDSLGLPVGERTFTMFVQTAQAGTWAAKEGEEGVYTLTLTGLPAQTVYFSDRPSRVVGTMPTDAFLGALGFDDSNPPNAALVTTAPNGDDDILVIELFNPTYTETGQTATLVYDARVLENIQESRLGEVIASQDATAVPASFDGASLFIDDCADAHGVCVNPFDTSRRAEVTWGCCFKFMSLGCTWCSAGVDFCHSAHPDICGADLSGQECIVEVWTNCSI